jgi:periplasmic protein TonB
VLACGAVGLVLLNSKDAPTGQTSSISAARPPQFSPEIIKLVADTEAAFGKDDFDSARIYVQSLRELAPNHPRLPFFQSLLGKRRDVFARGAAPRRAEPVALHEEQKSRSMPAPVVASSHRQVSPIKAVSAQKASASTPSLRTASFKQPAPEAEPSTAAPESTAPPAAAAAAASAPAPAATPAVAAAPIGAAATSTARISASTFSGRTLEDSSGASAEPHLIHRVPPEYPADAARRGTEGLVELSLSVYKDGTVGDVTVDHSEPADVFNGAAISAVRRWKYEPKKVNGSPVDSRVQVRLQFKLGKEQS